MPIGLYRCTQIGTGTPQDSFRWAFADYIVENLPLGIRAIQIAHSEYWWLHAPSDMLARVESARGNVPVSPKFDSEAERDAWLAAAPVLSPTLRTQLLDDGLTVQRINSSARMQDILKELMWRHGVTR